MSGKLPAVARSGIGVTKQRRLPTAPRLARRRWMLLAAKWLLPALALALLGSIALYPVLQRDASRVAFQRVGGVVIGAGKLLDPRYRGVDARGRPFMLTAASAVQQGQDRIDLLAPIGDLTGADGQWLYARSEKGVYMQHGGLLDMSGHVFLYRSDGTTLYSPVMDADLRQGAAASNAWVHAEGPFGVLDAQGFTLVDKAGVIQFRGPAQLVMNGSQH